MNLENLFKPPSYRTLEEYILLIKKPTKNL